MQSKKIMKIKTKIYFGNWRIMLLHQSDENEKRDFSLPMKIEFIHLVDGLRIQAHIHSDTWEQFNDITFK